MRVTQGWITAFSNTPSVLESEAKGKAHYSLYRRNKPIDGRIQRPAANLNVPPVPSIKENTSCCFPE
jgi:hypothetical protein